MNRLICRFIRRRFAELYNYSSSERDLSNCKSREEFMEHYGFVVAEIARVTKPGRMTAVHCRDLLLGATTLSDLPGDVIRLHEKHGFHFHSRHVIWKEPLMAAIRTRSLSLMHKSIVKDSTLCRVALPDYIIVMRKAGTNQSPVAHPMGLTTYAGEQDDEKRRRNGQTGFPHALAAKYRNWDDPKTNKWSHWIWQRYASSVWMDIRPGHLLKYQNARETPDEKHICPLQLDAIDRVLTLWSNPDDVVLTPFMGIGSEVYCAVRMGRRGIGIELKPSYFAQAKVNIAAAHNPEGDQESFDFYGPDPDFPDFEDEETEETAEAIEVAEIAGDNE